MGKNESSEQIRDVLLASIGWGSKQWETLVAYHAGNQREALVTLEKVVSLRRWWHDTNAR